MTEFEVELPEDCERLHGPSFDGVLLRGPAVMFVARRAPASLSRATICAGCNAFVLGTKTAYERSLGESAWKALNSMGTVTRETPPHTAEMLASYVRDAQEATTT